MTAMTNQAQNYTDVLVGSEEARLDGVGFRRLVENIVDGILVVDLEGTVLYANPAAARIFGQPPGQFLHLPLGRPFVSGDVTVLTVPRPGKKPAEVEMRVVEVAWGGMPALLATLRDVSAQRAADERQRQSQKLEALGRVAAGVVHDLKNLIAVFESGLRLLRQRIATDPGNPEITLLIDEMLKRTTNGSALTHRLLAFSRKQSLKPEVMDLNERVGSLGTLLERTLGNEIKIQKRLDPTLGNVLIDPNQLDLAILNLAVNARDAMSGRGTLSIETSNAPEDFDEMKGVAASFVRITVADNGRGMSEEVLPHVFEPFFTTKDNGEGTGLGLSQVYGFVNQSGGYVRIESQVNRGTQVHLFLPRASNSRY